MALSTRLLSAFAILVYLTAALSPCEEPERLRLSTVAVRAMTHPAPAGLESSAPLSFQSSFQSSSQSASRGAPRSAPGTDGMNATQRKHAHDHSVHRHEEQMASHDHHVASTAAVEDASSRRDSSDLASWAGGEPGSRESERTSSADDPAVQLAFTAPCVCGCGDTRATVGGGAARLGAVVPGQFVAQLISLPVNGALRAGPDRFVREILEVDPVPI